MNIRLGKTLTFLPILCTVLAAFAWAYTSFRYNDLNVGSGRGDIDFWDAARERVPVAALCTWVAALVATVLLHMKEATPQRTLTFRLLVIFWAGPLTFFFLHWLLHLGFRPPPSM